MLSGLLVGTLGAMSLPDPIPPDAAHLGPFALTGELLGRGGFADVWAGRHRGTGWQVAIKQPRRDAPSSLAGALSAEAQALAQLQHPGVVRILDVLDDDCIVMERAEGTAAEHAVTDWSDLRDLLLAALDALACVHSHGLLHRDIKPSNMLLGVRREPRQPMLRLADGFRLADFGIALGALGGADWPTAGSPVFQAPEQRAGDLDAFGPWTDLYALGRVASLLAARLRTGTPPGFEAWVARLTAEATHERPDRALEAALGLSSLGAPGPPSPPVSPVSAVRRAGLDASTMAHLEPVSSAPRAAAPRPLGTRRLPEDWRGGSWSWPAVELLDAGTGLLHLRAPRLVGREPVQDQLWSLLCEVAQTGLPRLIRLEGPIGSGRRALARWLGSRAHAVGAADVEHIHAGHPWAQREPDLRRSSEERVQVLLATDLEGSRRVRHLVQRAEGPVIGVIARGHGGEEIALPSLSTGQMNQLARQALRLEPALLEHVVDRSGGVPGRLLHWLVQWNREGALMPTAAGFVHRDGERPIPPDEEASPRPGAVLERLQAGDPEGAWALLDLTGRNQEIPSLAVGFEVLDALGAGPDDPRRLLLEVRREQRLGSDLPGQWRRLLALSRRAERSGAPHVVDEIEITFAQYETLRRGDPGAARARLARTRARIVARQDPSLLCWVHVVSVWPSTLLGLHDEAEALAERAVDLARDRPALLPYACLVRGRALRGRGRLDEAVESCRTGLRAQSGRHNKHTFTLLLTLATCLHDRGDSDRAVRVYQDAVDLAVDKVWLDAEGVARNNLGWVCLDLRDLDVAETHLRIALDRYQQTDRRDAAVRVGLALIAALRDDAPSALGLLADVDTERTLRSGGASVGRRILQCWCAARSRRRDAWPDPLDPIPASVRSKLPARFDEVAELTLQACAQAGWPEEEAVFRGWWGEGG